MDNSSTLSPEYDTMDRLDIQDSISESSNSISDLNQQPMTDTSLKQPSIQPISKSQKIVSLQNSFTESQKTAYVGLCYLICTHHKHSRLLVLKNKKAISSYEKWLDCLMEKLYTYLDFAHEEQRMIHRLAEHEIQPEHLANTLIPLHQQDSDTLEESEILESDIRHCILSHLFILSIAEGNYDARSRSLIKLLAKMLKVSFKNVCFIEKIVAEQIRVYANDDSQTELKKDEDAVISGNKKISKGRWMFAAAATLGGGLIIGLTAGLAAPLIGAGIGAGLATIGVSGSAAVGSFLASAAGIAIITTGGVLTGGGMSGYKMIKRMRGLKEFEFLSLQDGLDRIVASKEKRKQDIRKRWKLEVKQKSDVGLNDSPSSPKTRNSNVDHSRRQDSFSKDSSNKKAMSDTDPVNGSHFENVDETIEEGHHIPHDTHVDHDHLSRKSKQTNVIITVAGWIANGPDDYTLPFSTIIPDVYGDQYTLIWETAALDSLGSSLTLLAKEVTSFILQQGLQATLLPILMAGLTGPLWALKLTYFLDNPWGNALLKAKRAGMVMADTLIAQVQDNRPVTLLGFSLGARVIYYCLLELAKRNAFGIVEDAYLLGSPVMATKQEWEAISSVVSGRVVNGYLKSDWVLGYLYKTSSVLWNDVAGLNPIQCVQGVENIQLDDIICGHLEYRLGMPKIFQCLGFEVWRDFFDDEEEEEERDRLQLIEDLNKQSTEKKLLKENEKLTQDKKLGRNTVEINGILVKELETTLPTLVIQKETEEDKHIIIQTPESLFDAKISRYRSDFEKNVYLPNSKF